MIANPEPSNLGVLAAQLRERANMTQEQVSQLSGVSENTICRFENGKVSPAVTNVQAIFEALGYQLVAVPQDPRK